MIKKSRMFLLLGNKNPMKQFKLYKLAQNLRLLRCFKRMEKDKGHFVHPST